MLSQVQSGGLSQFYLEQAGVAPKPVASKARQEGQPNNIYIVSITQKNHKATSWYRPLANSIQLFLKFKNNSPSSLSMIATMIIIVIKNICILLFIRSSPQINKSHAHRVGPWYQWGSVPGHPLHGNRIPWITESAVGMTHNTTGTYQELGHMQPPGCHWKALPVHVSNFLPDTSS